MKYLRQLLMASVRATVFLLLLLSVQTASAKSPPFFWDFINVLIDVQENGDMLVTETQKYVFTELCSNERSRYIPLHGVESIDQISVSEGERNIPINTDIINNQQKITWRHSLVPPETRTFTLKYRIVGAMQEYKGIIPMYKGNDFIFLSPIQGKRRAPVQRGKVTIRLPLFLEGKVENFASFGVPTDIKQLDGRTLEFLAKEYLVSISGAWSAGLFSTGALGRHQCVY